MHVFTVGACFAALLLAGPAVRSAQPPSTGSAISGLVIDADTQAPIAGARVMLVPAPSGPPGGPFGPPPMAVTGDDGVYVLSGIAAGRYRLQVQKVGFVSPSPLETPPFVVATGQTSSGPDLHLRKGAAISGRVVDARGEGVPDVIARAVRPRTGRNSQGRGVPAGPAGQPGQTNDIGEFRITGLAAGQYYVTASPRPRSPFEQVSASGGTTLATTYYPGVLEMSGAQAIAVAAGQTISGLQFTMTSGRAFAIAGTVLNEMNQPVSGAMVMLVPTEYTSPPRGSTRTQPDGTFTIGGVARGTYRLNVSVPLSISSGAGAVTFGNARVVTLAASGGAPLPGSDVQMLPGYGGLQVTVGVADVTGVTVVVRPPSRRE